MGEQLHIFRGALYRSREFVSIGAKSALGALVCLSLLSASLLAGAPAAQAAELVGGETIDRTNQAKIVEVFNGINDFRASQGLKPVNFNATVSEMAEDWSDHMATSGDFYHNPNYFTDARVAGRFAGAAEIIAARSDDWAQGLVEQWIDSPGHNAIMSDPKLSTVGVGITYMEGKRRGELTLYGTVNFFTFWNPPVGMYNTAQEFFEGKPSIDAPQIVTVDTVDPVFDDTLNKVTVPDAEGVDYFVNQVPTPPGTYDAAVGRMHVTASAKTGFRAFGRMTWDHEFLAPPKEVVPIAPTFDGVTGRFTVPYMEGVQYWVNDSLWGSSTFSSEWDTTVYIRAEALKGYKLSGTTSWQYYFAKPDRPADPDPETPAEPSGSFIDVPAGTQFATEINWLASRGISTGWVDGDGFATYRPLTPVNRDAMAAFMYRLLGEPPFNAPAASPFADMSSSTKFYKEITWLADKRISTGWEVNGARTYRPVTPVNRDAMAAFLYRLAGEPNFTPPLASPFVDVDTSNQFYKEITWLAAQGISSGWNEGNGKASYRPWSAVNRDAMAAFMYRWDTKFGRP